MDIRTMDTRARAWFALGGALAIAALALWLIPAPPQAAADTGGGREPKPRWAGVWSDRQTIWVSDWGVGAIRAFNETTLARDESKDIAIEGVFGDGLIHPYGLYGDGFTLWVVDWAGERLAAINLSTGERDNAKDITLDDDNDDPYGVWLTGSTFLVSDVTDGKIYAYNKRDGARKPDRDITLGHGVKGIWSNGRVLWGSSDSANKALAFTMDGKRQPSWDINLDNTNQSPGGIWADGVTAYVVEAGKTPALHSYQLRPLPAFDVRWLIGNPSGIWADDNGVIRVSDWGEETVYALINNGNTRLEQRDIDLGPQGNHDAHGIWSDGTFMWVADWRDPKVYAYDLATGAHVPERDLLLTGENEHPTDLWGDWDTLWVLDVEDNLAYAYNHINGGRKPHLDFQFDTDVGFGIWTNGITVWAVKDDKLLAYGWHSEKRKAHLDIVLDDENDTPRGIWSDGKIMYVLNSEPEIIFRYPLPEVGGL